MLGSQPIPRRRYDTSYWERRHVGWDAYIEVLGNRYSVPGRLAGQMVDIRIGLDGLLRIFAGQELVTSHRLRSAKEGWVTVPEHHAQLWRDALQVERRSLASYEEATSWNS